MSLTFCLISQFTQNLNEGERFHQWGIKRPHIQCTRLDWLWKLSLGCMLETITCPLLKERSLPLSCFWQDRKLFIHRKMGAAFFTPKFSVYWVVGITSSFSKELKSIPRLLHTQIPWYPPSDLCVFLCLSCTKGAEQSPL